MRDCKYKKGWDSIVISHVTAHCNVVMAEGHVILEKDMSSVIDSSNSVNTPLLKSRSDRSTSQSCWKDHCKEADFELTENFPCWFKPLQYFILDRLPFIQWLRRYRPRTLVSDLIAGLTVGLMVVPQALAYASIAGLPLEVLNILKCLSANLDLSI